MTVSYCPQCGAEINGEFKFCPSCGSKLPVTTPAAPPEKFEEQKSERHESAEVLRCPTCGFANPPGSKSCESCGSFLNAAAIEETGESVQQVPETEEPAEEEKARKPVEKKKAEKKVRNQSAGRKISRPSGFHLEGYQKVAIIAALFLGGIFIYGLMTSKTTTPDSGGSMPSQQTSSSGNQPSADVLHEINRLRQVVGKEPNDLTALLQLSNMLQDNGFYDQAVIYYKRYLNKVPNNVDARVDYGVTLYEGGNAQNGIDQIKEALKTNPRHQIGLFNLGIIYLNTGQVEKANEAFKKCVKVDPNSDIGKKAEQTLKEHVNITSQEVN